jgi:phosphonate degradation associated HDIG domain protein
MSVFKEIADLFGAGIGAEYLGEPITLTEHMLQAAHLAHQEGAEEDLVVAALLHDVGHLLVIDPLLAQESNIDAHHDEVGAHWISERFPQSVSEPVRMHVAAKRYLVSTDPSYRARLSPASLHTLELQGGLLSEDEANQFLDSTWAKAAISVRLWDDRAKVANMQVPGLLSYKSIIENLTI